MIAHQQTIGTLLNGRYRVLGILGSGGTGTVYLAEHIQLDTTVALKEICGPTPNTIVHGDVLEQCRREGRLLVRLSHPNLPKVTDAFVENDRFYLAMEYIEGMTAAQHLRDRGEALEWRQVLQWGIQIAGVLAYLHCQDPPIIFRDLKPDNIMVQPTGEVKLIDFGIARRFQASAQNDTVRLGSVGFSPPEQFGLHQTDPRSDIYSLGATLHYLLTAHDPTLKPFQLIPAAELNPAVPAELSRLISCCLALDRARRPADAAEIQRELMLLDDQRAVVHILNDASIGNADADPDETIAPALVPPDCAATNASEPQERRTEGAERPILTQDFTLLLTGIFLVAVTLCSLLWIARTNRSPSNARTGHLTNVGNTAVPVSNIFPQSHRRTAEIAVHPQTHLPVASRRQPGTAKRETVSIRIRPGKRRSKHRSQLTHVPSHNPTAIHAAVHGSQPVRKPVIVRQPKGGETLVEHLKDADLETVFGTDK